MLNRRSFVKRMGAAATAMLTPFGMPSSSNAATADSNSSSGDLYAGFCILSAEAPVPSYVTQVPVPVFHDDDDDGKLSVDSTYKHRVAMSQEYESFRELKRERQQAMYGFERVPKVKFESGIVTYFADTKEVWEIRSTYRVAGQDDTRVTLYSQPSFPRPFPVWPVLDGKALADGSQFPIENLPLVAPEKVRFTPAPGLLLPAGDGFRIQWIFRDSLHTLWVENESRRSFVKTLCANIEAH